MLSLQNKLLNTRLQEATDRYETESTAMEEKLKQRQSELKQSSGKKEKRKIVGVFCIFKSSSQKANTQLLINPIFFLYKIDIFSIIR